MTSRRRYSGLLTNTS